MNSFDMSDKVYIDYNMTWQLFRDADCTEEIVDKVATGIDGTLAEGDNIFYLRTYYPDDTVAHTFTLNLHKSHPVVAELYGPLGNSIMAISFHHRYSAIMVIPWKSGRIRIPMIFRGAIILKVIN